MLKSTILADFDHAVTTVHPRLRRLFRLREVGLAIALLFVLPAPLAKHGLAVILAAANNTALIPFLPQLPALLAGEPWDLCNLIIYHGP